MRLFASELSATDRRIANWGSAIGGVLVAGLVVSGVWQFLEHAPEPTWKSFELGSAVRPIPPPSTGMADLHGTLADLAGILALFLGVWVSYRVLQQVSGAAVAALLIVIVGIYTGSAIRFNAFQRNGEIDTVSTGYRQVFRGDFELMVTDTRELTAGSARQWTLIHLAALPTLLLVLWATHRRRQRRPADVADDQPSWLDRLDTT